MQLIAAIKPDGNVTPGPGLTLLDVMFLEHQHGAALGRSRAARVAATAPRKGKERRELAAAIERVQANSRRRLPEAELAEKLNTSRKRIRWARGKSY